MPDLISADCTVQGTRLHYYRTGEAKPPLVLVHGITDDGLCWAPVAAALSGSLDVIMVDMRGHGKSAAPEDGYTLKNMAAELAGLIQALDLEKPFILGHSMGAITTLVLAGLFPGLARAILLEDPPPFWNLKASSPIDDESSKSLADWIAANKRKTGADLLAEARANYPSWSQTELEPWINSKHRYSPKITALVRPADILSLDLPNLFKRIACSVLFISADVSLGAISTPGDIAALQRSVPQLQVAHLAGAGHSIRRDQFSAYLAAVQRFLTGPAS